MARFIRVRRRPVLFAAAAALLNTASTHAVSTSFLSTTGGAWLDSTRWSNGVPNASTDALFNNGGTYTVTLAANANARSVDVIGDSLTLDLGTSTLSVTDHFAADQATAFLLRTGTLELNGASFASVATPTYYVSNGTTYFYDNTLFVSGGTNAADQPTIKFLDGGHVSSSKTILLGWYGGRGAMSASGADANFNPSTITTQGFLFAGAGTSTAGVAGHGDFTISAGAQAISSGFYFGSGGGNGTATVTGAGSSLTTINSGDIYVGEDRSLGAAPAYSPNIASNGRLDVTANAAVTTHSIFVGHNGGTGLLNLDASPVSASGVIDVGDGRIYTASYNSQTQTTTYTDRGGADGTVHLTNGAGVYGGSVYIGTNGGKGVVTVDASALGTNYSTVFQVGYYADSHTNVASDGTLTLTNGGTATTYGPCLIGYGGGKGVVTVSGLHSQFYSVQSARIGDNRNSIGSTDLGAGNGTLTVNNRAHGIFYGDTYVGSRGGTGTLNVDGVDSYVEVNAFDSFNLFVGDYYHNSPADAGLGYVNVSNGGLLLTGTPYISGHTVTVGSRSATGFITVLGTGSDWNHRGDAYLGGTATSGTTDGGTGHLVVSGGGSVEISGRLKIWDHGNTVVNLNAGGTLAVGSLDTTNAPSRFQWASNGGTLDITNSDFAIGSAGPLGGTLTLLGGQTLRVSGVGRKLTSPGGVVLVQGGNVYAQSLDFTAAAGFTFNAGAITVDSGTFSPKLATISYDRGNQSSSFGNAFSIGQATNASYLPSLYLTGGATSNTVGTLLVGNAGGRGLLELSNAGTALTTSGGAVVVGAGQSFSGQLGTGSEGTLNVRSGARLTSAAELSIGLSGAIGTALVDGQGSQVMAGGVLTIGDGAAPSATKMPSNGRLTISNGGQVSAQGEIEVERNSGVGAVTITGIGSNLTTPSNLIVGSNTTPYTGGSGSVLVTFGGTLNTASYVAGRGSADASSSVARIGVAGGTGSISLTSGGTWSHGGDVFLGDASGGVGSLAVRSGSIVNISGTLSFAPGSSNGVTLAGGGNLRIGALNTGGQPSNLDLADGTLTFTGQAPTADALVIPDTANLDVAIAPSLAAQQHTTITGNASLAGTLYLSYDASQSIAAGSRSVLHVNGGLQGIFSAVRELEVSYSRSLVVTYGAHDVFVTLAVPGDSNLDGSVGFADLLTLAQHFSAANVQQWSTGDFTGDGIVNFSDLLTLAQHFNGTFNSAEAASLPGDFGAEWALAQSLAPEPSLLLPILIASTGLRRRRSSTHCVSR